MNDRGNLQTFLEIMQHVSLEYADQLEASISSTTFNASSTISSKTGNSTMVVNIGELMSAVAMKIVGLALFSQDVVDGAIYDDITVCLEHVIYVARHPLCLPLWIPTRRNRKFRQALRRLDQLVYSFIESGREKRTQAISSNDAAASSRSTKNDRNLLNMLLAARYESFTATANSTDNDRKAPPKLSDKELRDEIMTLFLAGHETTANTLCWTLWFLSDPNNLHWQDKIAEEYEHIHSKEKDSNKIAGGNGYTPSIMEDAEALQITRAVLCEALRLRTPSYAVDRQVQQTIQVTPTPSLSSFIQPSPIGWRKNDILIISPMIMHLNPDYFEDPHDFNPRRFMDYTREPGQDLWDGPFDRSHYLPFGAGRKRCIGYKFAQWESLVILGTLLHRFRVTRPTNVTSVEWEAGVTLRPDRSLELVFETRQ